MSIFNTFNNAVKGMNAQQTALQTVSHNISNANTDGYSRQRVELKADTAYNYESVGQLGTGVKIEDVIRVADDFVNYQIRNENGTFGRFSSKQEVMDQLEIIFNEPSDTGLNVVMGELFDSWQELSKNPESLNSKTIVTEKSKNLVDTLNHMSNQMEDLIDDTASQIKKNVFDLHSLFEELDVVNKQIFNITVKNQSPNDLLDQRDMIMDDISKLVDVEEVTDRFGQISLKISGEEVVGKNVQYEMSIVNSIEELPDGTYQVHMVKKGDTLSPTISFNTNDASTYSIGDVVLNKNDESLAGNPLTESDVKIADLKSGTILGYYDAFKEIESIERNLDDLAIGLSKMINTVHKYDGDTPSGLDFFVFKDLDGDGNVDYTAEAIAVNDVILNDPSKVNAAYSSTSSIGDGSRALAIARLRNVKILFDDSYNADANYDSSTMTITQENNGEICEDCYKDMVITVGISSQHSRNMVENQNALLSQLQQKKNSVSGVSIDEEVTNLIKYQQTYQANAKVISTLTDMLDTLINRTGV